MPVEKKCLVCGKQFFVPPVRANTAKACSNECGWRVRGSTNRKRTLVQCEQCGVKFEIPECHTSRRRFCSNDCRYASETYLQKASERVSGDKNPTWAGGYAFHGSGYRQVSVPGHPFAQNGYVFEHRLLAEVWLASEEPSHPFLVEIDGQKYLRQSVAVHHINRKKTDNRNENFIICTHEAHGAIHMGADVGENEVWPTKFATKDFIERSVTFNCFQCGKEATAKANDKRGKNKFCSRACVLEKMKTLNRV